jgi:outer membrane protein TolC
VNVVQNNITVQKERKMRRIFALIGVLACFRSAAQSNLERYLQTALLNNAGIKEQQFILSKNLYALKEARSLFLPAVGFAGSYTLADGGRQIDFPVGDLLNPVYKTLNQLTGASNFPQLQNQHILLNPNNFYDAKIRTAFPLINAELQYNRKLKGQQLELQQLTINLYKRELVKEVKIAYFRFLQSTQAVEIYASSLALVQETLRVNQALFNNDKINRTAVLRSDNEVAKYQSLLESARQNQQSAKAYLNFLLNTDLNSDILQDSITQMPESLIPADTSVSLREELASLHQAIAINDNLTGLARSYTRPKLNSFVDLGSQAFDFKLNHQSLYYLAGISVEWNIFSGNRNKFRVLQSRAAGDALQAQSQSVEQQLRLQLVTARNAFQSAVAAYRSAQSQVNSSLRYYQDVQKLYKEGRALLVELLDAQNQLISARLQNNISLFDTWIKAAEIERANAGYSIN